jgi:hypothetical protein
MNYLIIASSILSTLLCIIAIYFITTTAIETLQEYNNRQDIKSKLHPEVSMKDIDNSEEFLYIAFDPELTQMVMNNDDSEQPIPMSIVSVDYEDMDD